MLVLLHRLRGTLLLGQGHGNDLGLEAPFPDGGGGPGLALRREGILVVPADSVALRQVLGGDAHVDVVKGVGQALVDHVVEDPAVAEPFAPAGSR